MSLPLVLLLAALGLMGITGWLLVTRRSAEMALRERLLFGMAAGANDEDADLTAGDYGLRGMKRAGYHAALFLGTWQGRALTAGMAAAVGLVTGMWQGRSLWQALSLGGGFALVALALTVITLHRSRARRELAIRRELPDVLEMLAAIMEGGIAFDAALQHVVREGDPRHPLYFELSVMLEAMRRGRRRQDALRLFGRRCNLRQVAEVVGGLTQADQSGGSIGDVLRHHARTLFREYEADVQRRAERLPIRMFAPMILTILPAMFIVTALPSFLRIFRVMEAIMRSR